MTQFYLVMPARQALLGTGEEAELLQQTKNQSEFNPPDSTMSDFNRKEFHKEVERRLKALDNSKLCAAFAVRMALLALPFLAELAEKKGFLWYWQAGQQEKHLFATCRISQLVFFRVFDFLDIGAAYIAAVNAADADAAADAAIYAADAAALYAARAAARAAQTATAAKVAVALYAADAAANALYAARAATNAADADLIIHIRQELDHLKTCLDVTTYLTSKISLPPIFSPLKETFLSQLKKMPEFDYWAEWLQDRYDGKPIDVELLRKSVLLPQEISAQSPREINHYLKQLRDGALQEKMKRVRAIFIGNGDAGKTSIIQALNNKKVIEGGTDMTPGIEISEWPVANSELTAHFWDFGGQVIAHATHQFFLRARCVYVLVLNARSADSNPNQQAEYWLEYVRAFGADAPVLLVGNKCDLTPVLLDTHRLRETYPNIQGSFQVSATEYCGRYAHEFEIFKSALCQQLHKVGEIQPYFAKNHFAVIETLREKSHKTPFLKKTTFNKLCKEQGISEEQRESLLDLLDKLGEIIYFPELAWLDEYLLNPRWLTYGVYPLLYSDRLKKQHGRLSKSDVAEILKDHKVIDNQGNTLCYPLDKQHLLLHAMEQFKLCYPSVDAKEEWIVPDLLPSDQPKVLPFDKRNALRFDFKFESFLPRHVLSMLIVEHYRDIWTHQVWQHGVYLHSHTWETEALVRANYQARVLSLEINGSHADRYFSELYASILKILNRMPKLKYTKLLYLDEKARIDHGRGWTDQEAYADLDDLFALEASGGKKYTCKFGTYNLQKVLNPMPNRENSPPPPPPPKNNPWTSGSFYLVAFVIVACVLGGLAYFVSMWLPVIVIGAVAGIGVIGALQLRNDEQLKETHFMKLMFEFYRRLFVLHKK